MPHPTRRIALQGLAAFTLGGLALPGSLAAHPLPGATITLAAADAKLSLTLSVPLAELSLAMGNPQAQPPDAGPLPPDLHRAYATYFADHLSIATADSRTLDLRVTRAYLERAVHDHIGAYTLLVLDFSAPVPADSPVFPLTLTYDAVMHEVRNHSAAVFWQSQANDPVALGRIHIDPATDAAAPLLIPAPP